MAARDRHHLISTALLSPPLTTATTTQNHLDHPHSSPGYFTIATTTTAINTIASFNTSVYAIPPSPPPPSLTPSPPPPHVSIHHPVSSPPPSSPPNITLFHDHRHHSLPPPSIAPHYPKTITTTPWKHQQIFHLFTPTHNHHYQTSPLAPLQLFPALPHTTHHNYTSHRPYVPSSTTTGTTGMGDSFSHIHYRYLRHHCNS